MTTREARDKLFEWWRHEMAKKGTPQFDKEKYDVYNKVIACVDEFFEIKQICGYIR